MSILLLLAAQAAGQPVTSYYPLPQQQVQTNVPQAAAPIAAPSVKAAPQSAEPVKVLSVQVPGQEAKPAVSDSATSSASIPPQNAAPAGPVTASSAPQPAHGKVLWRNIESGMTAAQLHSLYPAASNVTYKDDRTVLSDVPIIEGCQAKVNIMHPSGVVEEIVMRGEGSIAGRCSLKIITALSGKYGEPLDKDKVRGSLFGREGKNYIWTHDGVTLQLKRYTNGPLGGGGLFAASWELRYSSVANNIDL